MKKRLKFTFKPIEDGYKELFIPSKSHYKKDKEKKVRLKCTAFLGFDLIDENKHMNLNDEDTFTEERAEELLRFRCFEVVEGK
jgi:hypothetical protein